MALTNPLKIFQRIAKTGTEDQQFKQLCLDATDFSITINGTARTLATEFGYVWGDVTNLNNNVVWKVTSSDSYNRVYYVSADGSTQGVWGFTSSAVAGTLALRDGNGHVKVTTPVNNEDATTKLYVDSAITSSQVEIVDLTSL